MSNDPQKTNSGADDFEKHANEGDVSIVREMMDFLMSNKKWWLAPIFVMLLVLAGLVVAAGTGAAPFIYTLF